MHAFVDNTGVYQYLPWDHRGWHAGGHANNTHIGFEICEPAGFYYTNNITIGYDASKQEAYFRKAWENAVELCVMLCRKFGLSENDIICHSEGHKIGIVSNHADVIHWFPKHRENMDTFQAAVKMALEKGSSADMRSTETKKYYRVQVGAFSKKENAEILLKKVKAAGFDGFIKYS